MEQTSMDDILNEPKVVEKAVEPEAPLVEKPQSLKKQHQAKELTAQGRDPETGQFVPKEAVKEPEAQKEEKKAEEKPKEKPPEQEMTAKERAAFAAAADERRKRQDLERRLAELEKKPAPASNEAPKQFWDDPEGHFKTFEQKQQEAILEARKIGLQTRLQTSEMLARRNYKDFDEKIKVFEEIVQATPGLAQQWLSAPDPAEFAYLTAKNHLDIREAGSIDTLKEKWEKELRLKIEQEYKEKMAQAQAERERLPRSLSEVRGGVSNTRPAWSGPTPMHNILFDK